MAKVDVGYGYWRKYNRLPFDYDNPTEQLAVYAILFFAGKRAIFLRKDLTVLCTFETRKAKQLLDEAIEKGWRTSVLEDCTIGDRPTDYPKSCDIFNYIEVNKPKI